MNSRRLKLHPITAVLRFGARGAVGGLLPGLAFANPTGGVVVAGQAGINNQGSQTTITQSSQSAIVNWQTFSVGHNEYVVFNQPNASAAILNRVVGGTPSSILGNISANGRVFLINPQGVMFGQGSRIDVGSLVATTMDIGNDDFMAGRYQFVNGSNGGKIENAGIISAADGGFVVLAADQVVNSGLIQAKLGNIALLSGSAMTLNLDNEGLVNFSIDGAALSDAAGVSNLGDLAASGGSVFMSADVARQLVGTVVNNSGRVSAQSIEEHDGEIVLTASGGNIAQSGTLDASAAVAGANGGSVRITGDGDITLAGGSVTQARAGSASANGGDIRVVGEGKVDFASGARLDAGGGQNGFAELSGHEDLRIRGDVDLGYGGTLLIDPTKVTIAQGSGSGPSYGGDVTLYESFIEGLLQQQHVNVYIAADERIDIADLSANGGDGILDGRSGGYGGSLLLGIGTVGSNQQNGALGDGYTQGDGVKGGGIFFANTSNQIAVDGDLTITGGATYGVLSLGKLIGNNVYLTAAEDITATGAIVATQNGSSTNYDRGVIMIESTGGDITTHELTGRSVTVKADTGTLTALGDIKISDGTGTINLSAGHDLSIDSITLDGGSGYGGYGGYINLSSNDGDLTVDGATLIGALDMELVSSQGNTPGTLHFSNSTVQGTATLNTYSGAGIDIDNVTATRGNFTSISSPGGFFATAHDDAQLVADNLTAESIYLENDAYLGSELPTSVAEMRVGNLTATNGGISLYAGGNITRIAADSKLFASDSIYASSGQSYYGDGEDSFNVGGDMTLGNVEANGLDLYVNGGKLETGTVTVHKVENSEDYTGHIDIYLQDVQNSDGVVVASGSIGTTGKISIVDSSGDISIRSTSGFSVSGLDLDAGSNVDGGDGDIKFYSDYGSMRISDSTLVGEVQAKLGYDNRNADTAGFTTLAAVLPIGGNDTTGTLYIGGDNGTTVTGNLTAGTANGQAIEIGKLTASGDVSVCAYDCLPPSSITALDIEAGSIQLGGANNIDGPASTDIFIGSLHATSGNVGVWADRNIGIIEGTAGSITADYGGISLSAGRSYVQGVEGYLTGGGSIDIGTLNAGTRAYIEIYGGTLNVSAINAGGSGSGYYDVDVSLRGANDVMANIGSIGSISITGADHAGHVLIESEGDLDIASIGHIETGSSESYGGPSLGSVSLRTETGNIYVDSLDVGGDIGIGGATLAAHSAADSVKLTATGDIEVNATVNATDFTADAVSYVSINGDVNAGDGSIALIARDGDVYYNGVLDSANLTLQANSLSLGDIVRTGTLSLISNTGDIEIASAQASNIVLHAATDIYSEGAVNAGSTGSVTLTADTGTISTGTITSSNLSVTATALDFDDINVASNNLSGNLQLTATGGDLHVNSAQAATVTLSAANALNVDGTLTSTGATSLTGATIALADHISGDSVTVNGGALSGKLDLDAGTGGIALNNTSSNVSTATLTSTGNIGIAGPLTASGNVVIDGGTVALADKIKGSGITLEGGALSGKLDLDAGSGGISIDNASSNVSTATVTSTGQVGVTGPLVATGAVGINGSTVALGDKISGSGVTLSGGALSGKLDVDAGNGGIALHNTSSNVSTATLSTMGSVAIDNALTSTGITSINGGTIALGDKVKGSGITISGGALSGKLDLDADSGGIALNNASNNVSTATLTSTGKVGVTGPLTSTGATSINGSTIALADKVSASAITVSGGALSGKLDLDAGSGGIALNNSSSNVSTATLTSTGKVGVTGPLTSTGATSINGGTIALADKVSASAITVTGGALSGKLDLDAGSGGIALNNSSSNVSTAALTSTGKVGVNGTLTSTGTTSINGSTIALGDKVSASAITVTGGALSGKLDLNAGSGGIALNNTSSSVSTATLTSTGSVGVTGTLTSTGATSINGGTIALADKVSASAITVSGGALSGKLDLDAGSGGIALNNSSSNVSTATLTSTGKVGVTGTLTSTGATSINGGTIALADKVSGSAITVTGGALSGKLDLNAGSGGIALNNSSSNVSTATLTSTGKVGVSGPLTASGAVGINGDTVALADKVSGSGITVDGGALSGKLDLDAGSGGIALNSASSNVSTASLVSDGKVTVAHALTSTGDTKIDAGTTADFANITAANIMIDSGAASTLSQASTLSATGSTHIGGGSITGSSLTIDSASLDLASDLYADQLSIGVNGANGLTLDNVLLSGSTVALDATHGMTLNDLTIDAGQVTLHAGDALTATDTVIAGNLNATVGGHAQIDNATWSGSTAALEVASLDISDSRFAYSQSLAFTTTDGALDIHDSSFGTTQASQEVSKAASASGDVTLNSAGDVVIAGSDVKAGRLTITADGNITDGNSASTLDVAALRAEAGGAIDLAKSSLTIGSGDSGVGGDSQLLALLGQKAPDLLPTATAPNGYLRAQSIALGTLSTTGDYLSLNANALSVANVGSLANHLLVQIQPLATTTDTSVSATTASTPRATGTPLLSFADASRFASHDVSLTFGGGSYAGDITVDPALDINGASTNYLFMTSGHVNGYRGLATNGQVIVLAGIVATDTEGFQMPLMSDIKPASLGDTPPIDDNPAAKPDGGSLVTIEDLPNGEQCK